jgi:hypothetical protein
MDVLRRWRPTIAVAWLALLAAGLVGCSDSEPSSSSTSTTVPTTAATTTPATSEPTVAPSGPDGGPVPADFTAASVTFVSLQTGWVLGTAPCTSPPCTSLVRTRDGGASWVGIPAPPVGLATDRAAGVGKVRFADTDNGWAFGPDLWATHDGGATWKPVVLPGVQSGAEVSDLAAAGGRVHAAVIDSDGVHIFTSPVGTAAWKLSPTTVPIGAGPVPFAQIVLQGDAGWLIEVDRTVIAGARLSSEGSWVPWPPPCGDVGGPAFLAASTPDDLVAVCDEGQWNSTPRAVRAYFSDDGGTTFAPAAAPLPLSSATAVTSGRAGTAVAAGDTGDGTATLVATLDGGATWTDVYRTSGPRSWSDLGFTSANQGVAIELTSEPRAGSLLMTHDAGNTWGAVPIR